MKSTLGFIAAMSLTVSAFADLTKDELRLKVAKTTEVKALTAAYKKQGFECQNTEVLSVKGSQVTARKMCIQSDETGESAVIMEIEASLIDEESNAIIEKIKFVLAG